MAQKVYLLKPYIRVLGVLAVLSISFVIFWFLRFLVMLYFCLISAALISIIGFLYPLEKIILDEEGVTFTCRLGSITVQKITDLEVRVSRGKEVGLKIVGLTPDEKSRTVQVLREGDVGKRWEEFKEDLQKIKARTKPPPPKVEKCPSCGAEIPLGAEFCPNCGRRVR